MDVIVSASLTPAEPNVAGDEAIRTEGTKVQDVQTGLDVSTSHLHFHTSPQSESDLLLLPFFFLFLLPGPTAPFSHFPLNVLLTLFLPLSLRDGLSHLKLNTRPGATPRLPSVRPCLTSFFFFLSSFFIVSGERKKSGQK